MQDTGWIKIHRKITEWEWYDDANTFRVFLHILLTANHEDKMWRGQNIGAGQRVTSYGHLAEELNLSMQNVRTSLDKLKSTGELTIKTTNKFTLFEIKKWKDYQDANKQLTNNQQTTNKQLTTNKNDKNVRMIRNNPKGLEKTPSLENGIEKKSLEEPMNQDIDRSFPRKRLYGDEQTNWLLDYFEHLLSREPLENDKWSKIYLKHLKNKIGLGKVKEILDWCSNPDCWWYSRLTGFKMLYYKRDMLLKSMEQDSVDKEKNKKAYIEGDQAYQNANGDWMIIPKSGGQHLKWIGSLDKITWK